MALVYLNGQFISPDEAKVSVYDRGFLFGDGVYEVIPAPNKIPFREQSHLKRLTRSLEAMKIPNPFHFEEWHHIFETLSKAHPYQHEHFYIQITRNGKIGLREHKTSPCINPTVFVACFEYSLADYESTGGIRVITHKDIRWQRCAIKSTNLLGNVMLRSLADESGADEAIMINHEGYVSEAASANVFIVKDNAIHTTPLSENILGGITRQVVIELALHNNIPVHEGLIHENQLVGADEIWITSSLKDIAPVVKLNKLVISQGKPGVMWKRFNHLFQRYRATQEESVYA